jgi:hypothetical protein
MLFWVNTVNGGVCTLKLGSQSIVCIEENM